MIGNGNVWRANCKGDLANLESEGVLHEHAICNWKRQGRIA